MAKFCTKCGRKLEDGEVCTCTSEGTQSMAPGYQQSQENDNKYYQQNGNQYYQQNQQSGNQYYQQNQQNGNQYYQQNRNQGMTKEAEWFNEKKNAFVSVTKNMFSEILPILKNPVSRVKAIAMSNNPAIGMEFIISKGIIFLVIMLLLLLRIESMFGFGSYISIPYFKMILVTIIFTVGVDFLEALLLKVFTGLFNGFTNFNAMVSVVGARALYDTMIILVVGIFALLSLKIAFYIFAVVSLITPYIEYSGYQATVQGSEDRKPYAFFVVKACVTIVVAILAYIIIQDMLGGLFSFMNLADLF